MDSYHVLQLAKHDPNFNDVTQGLTHKEAKQAVIDAFNFLYTASDPKEEEFQTNLNTKAGFLVLFLLQHLLVRLLTKKLMNLMTTEALILNCDKIPSTYLENYLENQSHFSLKKAITNFHIALKYKYTLA